MNNPRSIRPVAALLAVSLVIALGACASAPVPVEQMAVAEAAVQRASSTSTSETAAGELQIAVAKLAAARQAVASKDYERAQRLAEQAQLDAQVAELHAQSMRASKSALETQDAARVLREEINRKTVR